MPGTWTPAPVTLTYQWLRSGSVIPGATGGTYRLVAADLGKQVSLRVTGTKSGYSTAVKTSAPTRAIRDALPATTTTLTFLVNNCTGCAIEVDHAVSSSGALRIWGPVRVVGGKATVQVPTKLTRGMAFLLRKPGSNGVPLAIPDAVSVVVAGYKGVPAGTSLSAAKALKRSSGSWCWAGTSAATQQIRIRYSVYTDHILSPVEIKAWGDTFITEWVSPTLPVLGQYHDTYKGALGEQDAPYC